MDARTAPHHQHETTKRRRTNMRSKGVEKRPSAERDAMKVVYISTPMKVKASPLKFREIVQELTGRQSDVVRIMETFGGDDTWMVPDHQDDQDHKYVRHDGHEWINNNSKDVTVPVVVMSEDKSSPAVSSSSEEFNVEEYDGVYMKGYESFVGQFDHPNFLYDHFCNQLDVLGSY